MLKRDMLERQRARIEGALEQRINTMTAGQRISNKLAEVVGPAQPFTYPIGAVFVSAGESDPKRILGYGQWRELVSTERAVVMWERVA